MDVIEKDEIVGNGGRLKLNLSKKLKSYLKLIKPKNIG